MLRDQSINAIELGISTLTTTEKMNLQPLFTFEICVNPKEECINQMEVDERKKLIENWKPPEDDKEAVCELEAIEPIIGKVFMYTYSVEQANDAVMDAFNNCLTSVNTIPQVEHQVMEGLFWSRRPNIAVSFFSLF
jgi:hypothetical protein